MRVLAANPRFSTPVISPKVGTDGKYSDLTLSSTATGLILPSLI